MPIFCGVGVNNYVKTPQPNQPQRLTSINTYLVNHGYRLSKIVGEGSYSKVRLCLVRDPNDDSESSIACKIINKRKASGDFVNKFLPRELQIVSRLRHPNIITVYDVVEFDQNVFIFMDYCNNGDLLEFIKQKGSLSERRTQSYFRQILSAVQYLHSLDLAHRDLKCENILLAQHDRVKLSDFGFSRYCRDNATGKRILSNTYCGSAAYAAPEILQGTMYNPKLYDMWSLGCILFIMLTGHMPYDESNVQKMLQNQMERVLTYPHQTDGLITKPPKRLIRHLLEPDVTRRATIEQALSNPWFNISSQSSVELTSRSNIETDPGGGDSRNDNPNDFECDTVYQSPSEIKGREISQGDYGRRALRPPPPSNSKRHTHRGSQHAPHNSGYQQDHVFNNLDGKRKQGYSSSSRLASSRQKEDCFVIPNHFETSSRTVPGQSRSPDVLYTRVPSKGTQYKR